MTLRSAAGKRDYFWTLGKQNIAVGMLYTGPASGSKTTIYSIEISGACDRKKTCETGKGLAIGDSTGRMKELYGRKYQVTTSEETESEDIHYRWKSVELRVTIHSGHVTSMQLVFVEE